jgi:hypothetical protein
VPGRRMRYTTTLATRKHGSLRRSDAKRRQRVKQFAANRALTTVSLGVECWTQ